MAVTKLVDAVVPEVFTPYAQQISAQKSRLIQSGVLVADAGMNAMIAGGGLTFNVPSWKDLADDAENIGSDDDGTSSTPANTGSGTEIAVRCNRNKSWSTMNLVSELAGSDPMQSIASRVGAYWAKRRQACFCAVVSGIFNDNAAAPDASEHTQNDLTEDVSGSSYEAGVTDFTAEAFIDATLTMGDSMEDLGVLMVHSVVYGKMQKNNLIDFIPDAEGRVNIPTFLGRQVITDDALPNPAGSSANGTQTAAGVYHSWIFGAGAFRFGDVPPDNATETERKPAAGNGQGQDILYNRVQFSIHPVGHKFAVASPASGGPSNANSNGNLSHAASWARVFAERKQIKIARLITRESDAS